METTVLVADPGAGRLDSHLAARLPDLSRSRIKSLISAGLVKVDGGAARPSTRLKGGEVLEITVPPPEPSALEGEDIPLEILFLDQDIVVVMKPAGLVVHPARGHRRGTLVNALLHHLPSLAEAGGEQRPGVVHRLDKGTSGVLVVARHDLALRRLQAQFVIRDVRREYLAVVSGHPQREAGTVSTSLGRHPADRMRFASVPTGGKRAVTHWRRLALGPGVSLLSCRLETGRTHQVRVHLSETGLPIVGDPVYGSQRYRLTEPLLGMARGLDHQLLHAAHLGFHHPVTGQDIDMTAPPPQDFIQFCEAAGLALPDQQAWQR